MLIGNVPLQCPDAKYPCNAQTPSMLAVTNHQVSLQCVSLERGGGGRRGRETLHFLCKSSFRLGMLEVNNLFFDPSLINSR